MVNPIHTKGFPSRYFLKKLQYFASRNWAKFKALLIVNQTVILLQFCINFKNSVKLVVLNLAQTSKMFIKMICNIVILLFVSSMSVSMS